MTSSSSDDDVGWLNIDELEASVTRAWAQDDDDDVDRRHAHTFFNMGAEDEMALRANVCRWKRYHLVPRVLRSVQTIDLSLRTYGGGAPIATLPIIAAPVSLLQWAHPEGELAVARACRDQGVVMGLSCSATCTLEAVADANDGGTRWFQLYVYRDRSITIDLVRRAERAGYTALVVTVDHPVLGNRERTRRDGFRLPPRLQLANLVPYQERSGAGHVSRSFAEYTRDLYDQSLTWEDIRAIRRQTRLPVIIKGITTPADARLAAECGCHVIVSNHGGRQLDDMAAPCDVLAQVVDAVRAVGDQSLQVYVDGGIRRGVDVLKAIALGATAVLIGRPVVWGLQADGYAGVRRVFEIFAHEMRTSLALIGCASIDELRGRREYVGTAPTMRLTRPLGSPRPPSKL